MCKTLANHSVDVTWIEFHAGPAVHPKSASILLVPIPLPHTAAGT